MRRLFVASFTILFIHLLVTGCNFPTPDPGGRPTASATPESSDAPPSATPTLVPKVEATAPAPSETPLPALEVDRIRIRTVEGAAEFFNTGTGEKFVPRGVNYVHFLPTEAGFLADCVMATDLYDQARVREDFRHLSEYGYNTVRIFFDICSNGPAGFTSRDGPGLNPSYLENMVDLMRIAGEEGIYIIFTANDIPDGGDYWGLFDSIFFKDAHPGFEDARNADWIHTAGVETKRQIWIDLMNGLAEAGAPFETVLGWQLTNEYWLWGDANPPFSQDSGLVTTANGVTYDMADPNQKQQMGVDGLLYFIERLIPVIKAVDPEGLVTMGFYAPHFSPERYIVTGDVIDRAPLDFWDFHAYYDADLSMEGYAESFGMLGYEEKPILMGEFAAGYEVVPSAVSAMELGVKWIAESCEYGFDGWLYWGYYPWPEEFGGKAWALLEDDERLFAGMSPKNNPDPCTVPELEVTNLAFDAAVTASRSLPDQPPANVADGNRSVWNAGDFPTEWIQINLAEPAAISRVGMNVEQWPPGVSRHRVTAELADGTVVFLGQFDQFTLPNLNLGVDLLGTLAEVKAVRVTTLESPAWVSWKEVEVLSAALDRVPACIGTADRRAEILTDPLPGAEAVHGLDSGGKILLTGLFEDGEGVNWGRSGGGTWVDLDALTLSESCASALEIVTPEPRLIPVTFNVTVPADTSGEVFLGGDFAGLTVDSWIPYMIVLSDLGGDRWSITIPLPVGSASQYVYTRSSWETIERPADNCDETLPRTIIVEDVPEITVEDTVPRWSDTGCGG